MGSRRRGLGSSSRGSHVGIDGNEKADFLAWTVAKEGMAPTGFLMFSKLFSLKKIDLNKLGRTPPSHSWRFGRSPRGSLRLMPRKYQTEFSSFSSIDINVLVLEAFWLTVLQDRIKLFQPALEVAISNH
ncbi:hypothetical protein TNCV_2136681 [Trichonephila clavipes]|nr:hypothetical protein TNCV_2136681 [Trichonephila clavipes]